MDRKWIEEQNAEAVLWDDCDAAIIGITPEGRAVYSIERLWKLFRDGGMTEEQAIDWVAYNYLTAWVGEWTPVHVYTDEEIA